MDSANKMQRIAIGEKLDGSDQSGPEGDADGERVPDRANAADGKVAIGNRKSLRKRISRARLSPARARVVGSVVLAGGHGSRSLMMRRRSRWALSNLR